MGGHFLRTYIFYECETSRLYHNSGTYIFMQKIIQMTYLTDKPEVMANQYHATFKVIDSIS